jgi:hypothetical protein
VAAAATAEAWRAIGSFDGATVSVRSAEKNNGKLRRAWVRESYSYASVFGPEASSAGWTATSAFLVDCENNKYFSKSIATDSAGGYRMFVTIGDPLKHVDEAQMRVPDAQTMAGAVFQVVCQPS